MAAPALGPGPQQHLGRGSAVAACAAPTLVRSGTGQPQPVGQQPRAVAGGFAHSLAGVRADAGGSGPAAGARPATHRFPAQVGAPAAGAVRHRRPRRGQSRHAGNAAPGACGGRRADVCREFVHRAVQRAPADHALPVFRRQARSVAQRSRSRNPGRGLRGQLEPAVVARWRGHARAVERIAGTLWHWRAAAQRPRQHRLAGRADAARRPGGGWDRGPELPGFQCLRRPRPGAAGVCRPAHPDCAGPTSRARTAGVAGRGAHRRTQAGQPGPAGRGGGAPALAGIAARAVPDRRIVDDQRDPGAVLFPDPQGGGPLAECAQFLHRDVVCRSLDAGIRLFG